MKRISLLMVLATVALANWHCKSAGRSTQKAEKTLTQRVEDRDYPSVFQAWYGIDMPSFPQNTLEQRLVAAAKHDLLWEEPLSQLGEKVDLVLGLVWDGKHHGQSSTFTKASLEQALANRKKLLGMNPNMTFLMEIRWRDAPSSFLPEDSPFWKRDAKGEIEKGWLGGWEPFYMLDYENPEFQDNVARQAKIAIESGVYDGIMLDWSGHLEIIKKVRKAIGDKGLIIVNIHDDIEDGEKFKDYINGSFMELNPKDDSPQLVKKETNFRTWDNIRKALVWFEKNLQEPRINCLEVWGDRKDMSRMRATTTLGLTHSDGYVLYADPNPLKTPDHLHDWYPFWDIELGRPTGARIDKPDGSAWRDFDNGTVVYNHYQNPTVTVSFTENRKRASNGEVGKTFKVDGRDGDLFLKVK